MIPEPRNYPDWRAWALQLVRVIIPFMTETRTVYFRQGKIPQFASYTVATLPDASAPGRMIYVSDETGGAVVAFSDGTNWRRVTDRAVVS